MRAVDKLDKVRPAAVRELLTRSRPRWLPRPTQCLALASISSSDLSFVDDVRALGVSDDLLDVGLAELAAVIEGAAGIGGSQVSVVADLRIARGLDYYTGTVYETRMAGFEQIGSVCSGGRYDSLAADGARVFPGVGISFGLTRALAPLFTRGLISASRPSPSCVLVAVVAEDVPGCLGRRGQIAAFPGDPVRGGAGGGQVRQADQVRRAPRHPVRLVPRRRWTRGFR